MKDLTKVLITGVNGFVGQHMGRYLLSQGIHLLGIGRRTDPILKHSQLHYESCDLLEPSHIEQLLNQHDIDYIIHLAAENDVLNSWSQPLKSLQTNSVGTLNLLESLRKKQSRLKGLLVVGSSHEYAVDGQMTKSPVISEQFPLAPTNPYGWSKMLQTLIAQMYAQLYSFPVIIARTFNLVGTGISGGVCAQLARQVIDMEKGKRPPKLVLGNINIQRDFLDVRDAVRGYWSLLQTDTIRPGEIFNICSGNVQSIDALVKLLQKYSPSTFEISIDPNLIRHGEPLVIQGDNCKVCRATGWHPRFSFETSIRDLLNYYRKEDEINENHDNFRNSP